MDIKKCVLLLLILFFFSIDLYSNDPYPKTIDEKYDLCFRTIEKNDRSHSWIRYTNNCSFSLDSLSLFEGKHPLMILPASKRMPFESSDADELKNKMGFVFGRTIILPKNNIENDLIEINLTCRSYVDSLWMQLIALDKNEDIVSTDLIRIPRKADWNTYSMQLEIPEARALKIILKMDETKKNDSYVYIDRIQLRSGTTDINSLSLASLEEESVFDQSYLISLKDSLSYSAILDIKDKKLIGLGECTHGSQDIKEMAYELTRYLIEEEGFGYFFWELPKELVLLFDLYIRGFFPDEKESEIIDILKCSMDNHETTFQFLQFLREYNQSADTQVRLFGMDMDAEGGEALFLADYFLNLLGVEDAKYYITNLGNINRYGRIIEYMIKDPSIQSKLTATEIKYLVYILEEHIANSALLPGDISKDRDYKIMFKSVETIVELFFDSSSKGVILSHGLHLNKVSLLDISETRQSLGSYLSSLYKNDYYSMGIQIGEGAYTQDYFLIGYGLYSDSLQIPPSHSLERICLNTDSDRFFYPADKFPDSVLSLRFIPRESQNRDHFYFCSPEKRFDGVLFIRNSRSLNVFEEFPAFYYGSYSNRKASQLNEILKSYRK